MRTVFKVVLASVALSLGGAAPALGAGGSLSVSFTTTENGGNYAPDNIVAVWIEDAGGAFVKTIGRWAATRRNHLVAWTSASGSDADAVSGATRANHNGTLTVAWDLLDKQGAEVPDGTYTIRMELADRNSNLPDQNHQGTFSFVKGADSSSETTAGGGFENVAIEFTVALETCGNGTLDDGETCDLQESCPTTCADTGDTCEPNRLVGSATSCTAECVIEAITECIAGDGCCATGCDAATDSDCATDPGNEEPRDGNPATRDAPVSGGCSTTGSGAGGLGALLLALGLLAWRRKRAA